MDTRSVLLRKWTIDTPLLSQKPAGGPAARKSESLGVRVLGPRRVRPCPADEANWPACTDGWCWHCCHPFDTTPLPLPIKYDDRRDVFHVTGTFCSWGCMKKYNGESASYLKHVNTTNITLFHKRCTGRLSKHIKPAPPRFALRVFGGTMSIDEFRAAADNGVYLQTLPPKMIVHHTALEQTNVKHKSKHHDMEQTICFKDASVKNETLRLKRPKPLQNNRNTLERAMGINALLAASE